MVVKYVMVKFFTQICPITAIKSHTNTISSMRCLVMDKGILKPIKRSGVPVHPSREFSEESDAKGPRKEEEIESLKMPGFVHPHTKNEEGYFTQKAQQQLEELKKRLEKPTIENRDKKD